MFALPRCLLLGFPIRGAYGSPSNISCNGYQLTRRYIQQNRYSSENNVLRSECLQSTLKNWHEQRKNRLTASTFGRAIGLKQGMRVQLWLEKIGKIEPGMYHIAQAFNNVKEEEALGDYMEMTRNSVLIPSFQVHYEHSWLGASPDGIIESDSGGVLEIKIRYSEGDMREVFPCKRIPLYYMPQAQGLMEITDLDWMHFYVWTPNGSSLFKIYRDVQYWELLKIALSDFWWKHVEPAEKICNEPHGKDRLVELRLLRPKPRPQDDLFALIVYYSKILVDNSELLDMKLGRKSQHRQNSDILNRMYYTV